MSEYIDKQKFIDELDDKYSLGDIGRMERDIIVNALLYVKPADVRPVVRGRWIPFTSEAAGDIWYCSACDIGFSHHMAFCPHCGAEMIGTDDKKED